MRTVALGALVAILGYLVVRLALSWQGANPVSFVLLLVAEVMSLAATCLYVYETWRIPAMEHPAPLDFVTDIAITTYDEPITVLEPTIIGSLRVRGVHEVWVLDDGCREEVRDFCRSMNVRYVERRSNAHAKAGNINHALPLIDCELLLLLDADHVPSRSIIEKLSGYFADPGVALVQSPHDFRNRDSAQNRTPGRHEQSLFFRVLMPARDRHDASFWCGSSALLRMSALREIGGVAIETVSEDLHTTTRLQQHGYRVRYHNEVLATGLAPHTMADFLLQRYRWAQGTLQVLMSPESPLIGRGWKVTQRLHYLNNLLYYLFPFQRLVYALVLVLVLLLGWLPIGVASVPFLIALAVSIALSNIASVGLARGMRDLGEGASYTWITAETHMRAVVLTLLGRHIPFKVTPKSVNALEWREKLALLRVPLAVIAVILVSWLLRSWQQAAGSLPLGLSLPGTLEPVVYVTVTVFVLLETITVAPAVVREMRRTQRRALWRFGVDLAATAGGVDVRVRDINESGIAVLGPRGLAEVGDRLAIVVCSPEGSDLPVVHGELTVSRVIPSGDRSIAGGPVTWDSVDDRRGVIALCYADLGVSEDSTPNPT
jgi:cellulose synthase (UDP-forming)